jgi:hypothetical protein
MQPGAAWADDHVILVAGRISIIIQLVLNFEFGRRAGENEVGHSSNMKALGGQPQKPHVGTTALFGSVPSPDYRNISVNLHLRKKSPRKCSSSWPPGRRAVGSGLRLENQILNDFDWRVVTTLLNEALFDVVKDLLYISRGDVVVAEKQAVL